MAGSVSLPGPNWICCTDQVRTVDVGRLARRLGRLAPNSLATVLSTLEEMFAP